MLKNYFIGRHVYELPLLGLELENVLSCQFNKRMILSLDWLGEKGIGLSETWQLRCIEMKSIKKLRRMFTQFKILFLLLFWFLMRNVKYV